MSVPSATNWALEHCTSDQLASLTGLDVATARQMHHYRDFPKPAGTQGRRIVWALEEVLRHILDTRPKDRDRIPRLFPRVKNPNPATHLTNTALSTRSGGEYVAHLYRPADGGGDIALAYPHLVISRFQDTDRDAHELLEHLGVSAVYVPSGRIDKLGRPTLAQADHAAASAHVNPEPSWPDLAHLLASAPPWWPLGLRRKHVMLAWRPGDPPVSLEPRSAEAHHATPTGWTALADALLPSGNSDIASLRAFFDHRANTAAKQALADHPEPAVSEVCARPVPLIDPGPEHATLAQPVLTAFLESPERHRAALRAIADDPAVRGKDIADIRRVRHDEPEPLARAWLSRLAETGEANQLGHHILLAGAEERDVRALVDPLDPEAMWIVRTGDLVLFTVPEHQNTPTPPLTHLALVPENQDAPMTAWWSDNSGVAWPLPGKGHAADYQGSGARAVAAAAAALTGNARSDALTNLLYGPNTPTILTPTPTGEWLGSNA